MNDILSRFLIVLGSESEAYWCFANYMETVKSDFLDDGMLDKISKSWHVGCYKDNLWLLYNVGR